jgi:hypothetical protein
VTYPQGRVLDEWPANRKLSPLQGLLTEQPRSVSPRVRGACVRDRGRETALSYTGDKLRPERSLPRTPRHVYGSDHAHVTDVPGQATVQMTGPPSGTGGNIVASAFTPVLAKGRSHYQ